MNTFCVYRVHSKTHMFVLSAGFCRRVTDWSIYDIHVHSLWPCNQCFFTCCIGNGSWIPEPHSHFSAVDQYEDSSKNVWLFNITADPNERTDLSSTHPSIVEVMLAMLDAFNGTAVPCRYPKEDHRGDPALLGGYWGPWLWNKDGWIIITKRYERITDPDWSFLYNYGYLGLCILYIYLNYNIFIRNRPFSLGWGGSGGVACVFPWSRICFHTKRIPVLYFVLFIFGICQIIFVFFCIKFWRHSLLFLTV